jgi:hypothetical protein
VPDSPGVPGPLPEDVFNDALELPADQRAAYLAQVCAGDENLRIQIAEMLALAEGDPALLQPPESETIPRRLGKYELLEERGRGGMGIVYAARDTQLDRVVALKLLPASLARDAAARERFTREARLLATLRDERIATIYTFEEVQGCHFLTMECVEGRTLAEFISDGPLPLRDTLRICQQIAEALEATHARQIIHRDLKPSNIMITLAGGVKILDFGIAKALGDVVPREGAASLPGGEHTAARGTPAYMAPEQLLVGATDHRCDIWALGCVLYECLTGRRAIVAVGAGSQPNLSDLPPGVPESVRSLIGRCLAIDPREREAAAGNAAAVLGRALADMQGRSHRRRLLMRFALAAVLVALALVLAREWWPILDPIESVEVAESRILRAKDAAGRVRWVKPLPAAVVRSETGSPGEGMLDGPVIVRAGDHVRAVIVATEGFPAAEGGAVWCLTPRDGHLKWRWDATWQPPVNAMGSLRILRTAVLARPGQDDPVIAVVLVDGRWYGSAVQFLDSGGQPLGTYYHAGALEHITTLAAGPDGTPVYLLAGLNSSARFVQALNPLGGRAHCGCLVLLSPNDLSGQGFPYSTGMPEPRDWPGMPPAREIAYVAIPLLQPTVDSRVTAISVDESPDGTPRITAATGDGRYFFFDQALHPLSCYVRTHSIADSLHALGEAHFLPLMLIRDGETTWQDVETTF